MTQTEVGGDLRALVVEEPGGETTAEEATTAALRRAIMRGILRPGDRLRQEILAAEFGVSRIPLRDAFRRLEAEGLIRIDGRRGARVAALTIDEVAELYELRRLLEVHCIRLAIRNVTDDGAAALLVHGERLASLFHESPTGMHLGHDLPNAVTPRSFYAELYGWSARPRMTATILQLRHELNRYHNLKDVSLDPGIHDRVLAAIRARDPDAAGRAMREHLRASRDRLLAELRREAGGRVAMARKDRGSGARAVRNTSGR